MRPGSRGSAWRTQVSAIRWPRSTKSAADRSCSAAGRSVERSAARSSNRSASAPSATAALRDLEARDPLKARLVELWEPLRAPIEPGDQVRLIAGCDKRFDTCRLKFNNLMNFQGFPDIPGEDWVMAVPKSTGANTGGSRR